LFSEKRNGEKEVPLTNGITSLRRVQKKVYSQQKKACTFQSHQTGQRRQIRQHWCVVQNKKNTKEQDVTNPSAGTKEGGEGGQRTARRKDIGPKKVTSNEVGLIGCETNYKGNELWIFFCKTTASKGKKHSTPPKRGLPWCGRHRQGRKGNTEKKMGGLRKEGLKWGETNRSPPSWKGQTHHRFRTQETSMPRHDTGLCRGEDNQKGRIKTEGKKIKTV